MYLRDCSEKRMYRGELPLISPCHQFRQEATLSPIMNLGSWSGRFCHLNFMIDA